MFASLVLLVLSVSGMLSTSTSYGVTDYTGYKVVVHGSDGVDYNCVVNSDSKYVIRTCRPPV